MSRLWCLVVAGLLVTGSVSAQVENDVAAELSRNITGESIRDHLEVLASAEFQGRETGTPGNTKAAEYIREQLEEAGIAPVPQLKGYFQEVLFSTIRIEDVTLTVNGVGYTHHKDFIVPVASMPLSEIQYDLDEVTFLGYGIDDPAYSDYGSKDVSGKAILIYKDEPTEEDGRSWITREVTLSPWSRGLEMKLQAARKHGVAMVYVIEDRFRQQARLERYYSLGGHVVMGAPESRDDLAPHMLLSSHVVEAMLGRKYDKVIKARDKIKAKGKPRSVRIKSENSAYARREVATMNGVNVLAFIEGLDPVLKNEVVVLTAHYDHVGMRGDDIFYGADDNASGTSGIISIAETLQKAKDEGLGPRRSILCMLVTGEEKGLLGSQYYSEYPVFPLENTIANINIDMIGRIDDSHDHPDYIYVIGSDKLSSDLHEINEAMNEKYTHLDLDYKYNADNDPNRYYYRSDHYNFAVKGIPVVFFFSGNHADYHRPTDTVDKILFDRAAKVARLAFHTAWELANRDERIKVDRS